MSYQTPSTKNNLVKWIRILIVVMIVWVLADLYNISPLPKLQPKAKMKTVTQPQGNLGADERSTIDVFKNVSPSVVFITNKRLQKSFFSPTVTEIPQGAGSGFLWDDKGHVVTNFHVIVDAHEVEVKLQGGQRFDATLVGADPDHDLAVLRIPTRFQNIKPVMIGTSSALEVPIITG